MRRRLLVPALLRNAAALETLFNPKTADALGLVVSPGLLALATEVIE